MESIVLMISSVVFSAIIGLIFNLKYYNLDWKDEQEIVKQEVVANPKEQLNKMKEMFGKLNEQIDE